MCFWNPPPDLLTKLLKLLNDTHFTSAYIILQSGGAASHG